MARVRFRVSVRISVRLRVRSRASARARIWPRFRVIVSARAAARLCLGVG